MTDTTLIEGGHASDSPRWVRRTVLVTFCLLLVGTLGVVFTRVIAERVPQQRATLEKLITDRTGLAVRFDNVHFAWDLDGTSAVFERVELTDPKRGRVRVVAPELRVEFDTWDYLRNHQFSLGHVTLSSPDIEIVGDPVDDPTPATPARAGKARPAPADDEAALIRRFVAWAELMPDGRIEVEGARVHLLRRGDRAARNSFTLSQAVVSRSSSGFSAFGTMLLSQDLGQSLFVSAKLEGLGASSTVSGNLRVIARRVFLDKLPLAAKGRGTLDASLRLENGLIHSATWQASARELDFGGESPIHFDHFTVHGRLERDAGDFLMRIADLQLTRGARLERAPNLTARVSVQPGTTRIARTTLSADRVPFMAAELIGAWLVPQLGERMAALSGGWGPTAGELRRLRFDSRPDSRGWIFSAELRDAELTRPADRARIGQLAANLQFDANELRLTFSPQQPALLRFRDGEESRPLNLGGELVVLHAQAPLALRFEDLDVRSGASSLTAHGLWSADPHTAPLVLTLAQVDRALLRDGWSLLAPAAEPPALFADIERGSVVEGTINLHSRSDAGRHTVNWQRSNGALKLADLATTGTDVPHLTAGHGTLNFSRGNTQLRLAGGELDQLAVTAARVDWPRQGEPRLHAALRGELSSPILQRELAAQGLERLSGAVTLEADARGEKELRQPDLWRVSAQLTNTSIPLGGDLPPIEKLAGTIRIDDGQLRGIVLAGSWLGGPIEFESRRAATRANLNIGVRGVADAAPLLRLLGQADAASRIGGQLSWSGSMQRLAEEDAARNDDWQLSLASNLAGVESRMPDPFDKARSRQFPVTAQLRLDADGIHDFTIEGRELSVRGQLVDGAILARFDVQGVAGELRRAAEAGAEPRVQFEQLDMKRAPAVLAAAGVLLAENGELLMNVDDLRYADNSLGALEATITRRDTGTEFSLESAPSAPHRLAARGACGIAETRCRIAFTADTQHLAALLRGVQLPAEWPTEALHADGELTWPVGSLGGDLTRVLAGRFDLETQGRDSNHQLIANATLADGRIELANLQGTGPAADQIFRGNGYVALAAREYDLTIDYEQVALAATAVPTPARARLARAWNSLRGSAVRRGWTEAPEARRMQWHGTWEPVR
jgi:hypothetical protein